MLRCLVTLVADVVNHDAVAATDRASFRSADLCDCGRVLLVNDSAEANAGVVAPEAVLVERRRVDEGVELHGEGDLGGAPEPLSEQRAVEGSHAFVGVDVEDPLAGRAVEGDVAGSREVFRPDMVEHEGSARLGDSDRRIGRPGVDDDDFVDNAGQGVEAAGQEALLVADNHRRADERSLGGHGRTATL